jgi:hypothetical protein
MFCPRHNENCAGEAGTSIAADSKRSLGGRMSGLVAEPTARRRLTKPGMDKPQNRRHSQAARPDATPHRRKNRELGSTLAAVSHWVALALATGLTV